MTSSRLSAPEQAEGRGVDARSDIFSFGSVLYEMVTGRRAFSGETKISTLSAILHKEPPPLEDAPPERPVAPPIPIHHSHEVRLEIGTVCIGRDRMIFTLAERTGNIWMAEWTGRW